MANWHLVAWLLNLNVLERNEFRSPDLHRELASNLIDFALFRGALDQGIELFLRDHLVDFKAANVAHVDGNLHLRLHIGAAHHDAPYGDQLANLLGFYLPHLVNVLLAEFPLHNKHLVAARQFLGDAHLLVCGRLDSPLEVVMLGLGNVEATLLHQDIKWLLVSLLKVDRGFGHRLINDLGKQVNVPGRVDAHAVAEVRVSRGAEEFLHIVDFDLNDIGLAVGHLLQLGHVLQFAVNGVFESGVLESGDEFSAPGPLCVVVRQVQLVGL